MTRKAALRDGQRAEIETLSRELAIGLQLALRTTAPPPPTPSLPESHRAFEKQILQIQQDTDDARREMASVVESLRNQIGNQSAEIAELHRRLDERSSSTSSSRVQDTHTTKISATVSPEELAQTNAKLAELADQVTLRHRDILIILRDEVPLNVRQSIGVLEESVHKAARESIQQNHHNLSEEVKRFATDFETRITTLEQRPGQILLERQAQNPRSSPPAIHATLDPQTATPASTETQAKAPRDQGISQNQGHANQEASKLLSSRDPRRRHSALPQRSPAPNSDTKPSKSTTPDADPSCRQQ